MQCMKIKEQTENFLQAYERVRGKDHLIQDFMPIKTETSSQSRKVSSTVSKSSPLIVPSFTA